MVLWTLPLGGRRLKSPAKSCDPFSACPRTGRFSRTLSQNGYGFPFFQRFWLLTNHVSRLSSAASSTRFSQNGPSWSSFCPASALLELSLGLLGPGATPPKHRNQTNHGHSREFKELSGDGMRLAAPGMRLAAPAVLLAAPGMRLAAPGMRLAAPGLLLAPPRATYDVMLVTPAPFWRCSGTPASYLRRKAGHPRAVLAPPRATYDVFLLTPGSPQSVTRMLLGGPCGVSVVGMYIYTS